MTNDFNFGDEGSFIVSSSANLNGDTISMGSVSVHSSAAEHRPVEWQERANTRFKCKIPIIYKYFNVDEFSDEFTTGEGIAYNYSLIGMYFETTCPICPDLPVYIQAQDGSLSVSGLDAYEGHHAEVKWCRKKDNEFGPYYNVGVQFYEPLTHSLNA